jgi:hypothetical protein
MAGKESPTTAERRIEVRLTLGQAWGAIVALVAVVSGAFGFGWAVSSWISGGEIAKAQSDTAAAQMDFADLQGKYDDLNVEHEKLKTKEGVLRLFYFYHLAKLKEEEATREAALAARDVEHLVGFPKPPRRVTISAEAADAAERERQEYERKYKEYYESLDAEGRQRLDEAQSKLAAAEAARGEAHSEAYEAGKAFIALWAEEKDRARYLGITLEHISKGGGGEGTISFAYDNMAVQIPNEFLPKVAK